MLEARQKPWAENLPMWLRGVFGRPHQESALFTKAMLRHNRVAAKRHGVESACHPQDLIYEFVIRHPEFRSVGPAVDYYFDDGARSADKLSRLLAELPLEHRPIRLLEFASGYGCVTRHLKKQPDLAMLACDIHPQAIDFLRRQLGVRAVMSAHTPEELSLGETFDAVFALSFFSHMPRATWGRWVRALFSHVAPGGFLIFTTHGLGSRELHQNPDIPSDGFWFTAISEQADLDKAEYGSTIVTPEFVAREVRAQTGESVFDHRYAFWWGHQDLWIVRKTA